MADIKYKKIMFLCKKISRINIAKTEECLKLRRVCKNKQNTFFAFIFEIFLLKYQL